MTFRDRTDPAWNIYRQAFDGGPPVALTHFAQGRVTTHNWSPGGRKLVARVEEGDASSLWIVEADGSHPVQVARFEKERIFSQGWMPDSRRLVLRVGTSTSDAVLIREFR